MAGVRFLNFGKAVIIRGVMITWNYMDAFPRRSW